MSEKVPMHDMLTPLAWLLGKWRSEDGKGHYPTMSDFKYGEEAEFFHFGAPAIQFSLYSWNVDTKAPLHRETGFIRIQPDKKIAVMSAHNFGVSDIQEGEVKEKKLTVKTSGIVRMSFAKDPTTQKVHRTFRRTGEKLEQVFSMETSNTPMTEHLRITYTKVE